MALSPDEIAYEMTHITDNKSTSIFISESICLGAATLAVAGRMASRYFAHADYGMDDWLILAAWVTRYISFIGRSGCGMTELTLYRLL